MSEPMKIDLGSVDPTDIGAAIQRAMAAMSAKKNPGRKTRGPDSVGKPFGARQARRAAGRVNREPALLAHEVAWQSGPRAGTTSVEMFPSPTAIKRVTAGRTR